MGSFLQNVEGHSASRTGGVACEKRPRAPSRCIAFSQPGEYLQMKRVAFFLEDCVGECTFGAQQPSIGLLRVVLQRVADAHQVGDLPLNGAVLRYG